MNIQDSRRPSPRERVSKRKETFLFEDFEKEVDIVERAKNFKFRYDEDEDCQMSSQNLYWD